MNEEKVKRGRGRPIGGISHIGISASELAKYCADHPNDTIMVSRVFWEKNGLITSGVTNPKVDIGAGAGVEWVTPSFLHGSITSVNESSEPKIEMTLSE
jgi:hypothetical protein